MLELFQSSGCSLCTIPFAVDGSFQGPDVPIIRPLHRPQNAFNFNANRRFPARPLSLTKVPGAASIRAESDLDVCRRRQ